jgi:hypothetical protein
MPTRFSFAVLVSALAASSAIGVPAALAEHGHGDGRGDRGRDDGIATVAAQNPAITVRDDDVDDDDVNDDRAIVQVAPQPVVEQRHQEIEEIDDAD